MNDLLMSETMIPESKAAPDAAPETPAEVPPDAAPPAPEPAPQPASAWRPGRTRALGGTAGSPIRAAFGQGSESSCYEIEMRLVSEFGPAGVLPDSTVSAPIEAALREQLRDSREYQHFRALNDQHAEAVKRLAVSKAKLEAIGAARRLCEAQAPANLGAKLVKFSRDVSAAQEQIDVADAEVRELAPLRDAAHTAAVAALKKFLPPIVADVRVNFLAEVEEAREGVFSAIAASVSEQLTRYARLSLAGDAFFRFARDWSIPMVQLLTQDLGEPSEAAADFQDEAPTTPAEPPPAAPDMTLPGIHPVPVRTQDQPGLLNLGPVSPGSELVETTIIQ